jgi:hypothetical protein
MLKKYSSSIPMPELHVYHMEGMGMFIFVSSKLMLAVYKVQEIQF